MTTDDQRTCWLEDDAELHPETECPESGEWMTVATDGRKRWICCDTCDRTWFVKEKKR